ncbi:WXG100 family type VII secretion target [Mycobacterium paraterrae]|uniref:WXG100 family type VII secretion target n=1 Tax=Mycobacterium paraterrae TaxID=577492 RepID=A0ABY3VPQ5_9MYCO|nr:WXG100 family type VII secretion target [Mycobacterium paraterrae]UMB69197.1 WXG100 family type VII secretion target [Mycobacterium paraterrae]
MAILRVDLETLAGSAAHVAGQGEDLANAHLASDNRIAGAEPGWVGASAAALSTTAATWSQTSRRLLARVGDHALELTGDGIAFAAMGEAHAVALRMV